MVEKLMLNHIVIQVDLYNFSIDFFKIFLLILGVFIARAKDDDMLLTKNMVVGESVYGEKRISVDVWKIFLDNHLNNIKFCFRLKIKKKLNIVYGIPFVRN